MAIYYYPNILVKSKIQKSDTFHDLISHARIVVKKTGQVVGIKLNPHDLHRHAATYASRAGAPIQIVNKAISRHSDL